MSLVTCYTAAERSLRIRDVEREQGGQSVVQVDKGDNFKWKWMSTA